MRVHMYIYMLESDVCVCMYALTEESLLKTHMPLKCYTCTCTCTCIYFGGKGM